MKKINFYMSIDETVRLHDFVMDIINDNDITMPDKFIDFKYSPAIHAIEHVIEQPSSEDSSDIFMKCTDFMKFEVDDATPTLINDYGVADIYGMLEYLYKFRVFIRRLIKFCNDFEFHKSMHDYEKIKYIFTSGAYLNIFNYGRNIIKFANFNLRNVKRKRTPDEVDEYGRKVFNKYNELIDVLDRDVTETEKIFNEFSGGQYWYYGKKE